MEENIGLRSVKNVVDELEYLHKTYGGKYYTFCDDAFTVDQARTSELCEEIKRRGLKIQWNCGTRVDMVTKELLQKMKDAGCVSVWFGVESGSQKVLDNMHKGISTKQTVQTVGWVRELGLKPTPNVLLGFPGETKESAWKTIKFAEKISPNDIAYFNIATPYPGTPMYDMVVANSWLRVTDFDRYDAVTPIFETPTMSLKMLSDLYEQAFESFYLRPSYVLRQWRRGAKSGYWATRYFFRYLSRRIKSKL